MLLRLTWIVSVSVWMCVLQRKLTQMYRNVMTYNCHMAAYNDRDSISTPLTDDNHVCHVLTLNRERKFTQGNLCNISNNFQSTYLRVRFSILSREFYLYIIHLCISRLHGNSHVLWHTSKRAWLFLYSSCSYRKYFMKRVTTSNKIYIVLVNIRWWI